MSLSERNYRYKSTLAHFHPEPNNFCFRRNKLFYNTTCPITWSPDTSSLLFRLVIASVCLYWNPLVTKNKMLSVRSGSTRFFFFFFFYFFFFFFFFKKPSHFSLVCHSTTWGWPLDRCGGWIGLRVPSCVVPCSGQCVRPCFPDPQTWLLDPINFQRNEVVAIEVSENVSVLANVYL